MDSPPQTDRIEKEVELHAPPARVWRALTDHREFGAWFGVDLESPFVPGSFARGRITHPGYEHLVMELLVVAIEPQTRFAFEWHPYAIAAGVDYSQEPPTLVEFTLRETPAGTMLRVTESGFDALPPQRRSRAFPMNERGWTAQMNNIRTYVAPTA